jgi:hypothetical protein
MLNQEFTLDRIIKMPACRLGEGESERLAV